MISAYVAFPRLPLPTRWPLCYDLHLHFEEMVGRMEAGEMPVSLITENEGEGMLRPPKVIIYDCDGVLFDSKEANEAFYNHILDHFGMPPLEPEQLEFVYSSTVREKSVE